MMRMQHNKLCFESGDSDGEKELHAVGGFIEQLFVTSNPE